MTKKTGILTFLAAVLIIDAQLSVTLAESSDSASQRYTNPGWGNAEHVCDNPRIGNDSPRLSFRGGKNDFSTGFYRIGRLPVGNDEVFLDVDASDPSTVIMKPGREASARRWLITAVGAGLYQISTCLDGAPQCLELAVEGEFKGFPRLQACHYEALGTQVWWTVGSIFGDTAGGTEFGNDALGRMDCLDLSADAAVFSVPRIMPCGEDTRDVVWRVLPAPEAAADVEEPPPHKANKQPAEISPETPVQPNPEQPKNDTKPTRKTL